MATDQQVQTARVNGEAANFKGLSLRDNPHPPGTYERRAWDEGYAQAQLVRNEWLERLWSAA
jgi:hypothetical protein